MKKILVLLSSISFLIPLYAQSTSPIHVCATVPELGALVREVGGETVQVTVFATGKDNPHNLDATPGFIKAANRAKMLVLVGLDLEIAWLPAILQNARNSRILPGKSGYLDASRYIQPLEVPTSEVDRSMGDVHPYGNPHYLLDPINAHKVAKAIRDRLKELKPGSSRVFEKNFLDFERRLFSFLVGNPLTKRYDVTKLARLMQLGKLDEFLIEQKELKFLGGWFSSLLPFQGTQLMEDHKSYGYLASRFGLEIWDQLESRPGIQPGFKHLKKLIRQSAKKQVRHVLTSPFFPRKLIRFLTSNSEIQPIKMAHQMGALPGTDSYIEWIQFNVDALTKGLEN